MRRHTELTRRRRTPHAAARSNRTPTTFTPFYILCVCVYYMHVDIDNFFLCLGDMYAYISRSISAGMLLLIILI